METVISGVPQGSVLDLFLFIFVNTLEKGIDGKALKFVDNLKVLRAVASGQNQDVFSNLT